MKQLIGHDPHGKNMVVFTAYGWPSDPSDEEILEKLLALKLEWSK